MTRYASDLEKQGSFTGPINGAAQDDNIKASLDLAHTDLDSILTNLGYIQAGQGAAGATVGGQRYTTKKALASITTSDVWDVAGGPILIENIFGIVTTNIQAQACTVKLGVDSDTGWVDYDFSTAVDLNGVAAGTRIVFSNANEAVLTPLLTTAGGTTLMTPIICAEGMIEMTCSATNTGAITWYMMWTPLDNATTVTAQ